MYKNYREMIDEREKGEWERIRLICAYTAQPHSKKRISIRKMMPFPWDNESTKKESQKIVSSEEGRERYLKLLKKLDNARTDG